MKVKKISSLIALSAGILLLGGVNAKAASPYDSVKADIQSSKSHVQSAKLQGLHSSHLDRWLQSKISQGPLGKQRAQSLLKAEKSTKLLQSTKGKSSYNPQELSGINLYENEPNDLIEEADYLPQGDVVYGTFGEYDVDTYAIEITKTSHIGILGMMDPASLSDIGFILDDQYENMIEPVDMYLEDHTWGMAFDLEPGVYFIRALNMGDIVTNDEYALVWDDLDSSPTEDVTPPDAPIVNRVDNDDTFITGSAEPYSEVDVYLNGQVIGYDYADENGKYKANLQKALPVGTRIAVTATDDAGNVSDPTTLSVVQAQLNGWVVENGKTYHYTNGVKNKGWYQENGKWFFLDKQTGEKRTGWVSDGGKWYFLDSFGVMKTGWVYTGGQWYYLSSNGSMKTGWLKDGGSWYYLKSSGAMATGWVQVGTKWYYLYSNGKMAYSTKINGYKLGADGAWIK